MTGMRQCIIAAVIAAATAAAALGVPARQTPSGELERVLDRIVENENRLSERLAEYDPLVETYVQVLEPDDALGTVPKEDRYFLGRADFGAERTQDRLVPLNEIDRGNPIFRFFRNIYTLEFFPSGFSDRVLIDPVNFNRDFYRFTYVRREFLDEVRTLVFDVRPVDDENVGF